MVMDVRGLPILPVDRFIDELSLPVASLTAPSTLSFVPDFIYAHLLTQMVRSSSAPRI